jgi:hypothetical protein
VLLMLVSMALAAAMVSAVEGTSEGVVAEVALRIADMSQ